MPVASVKPRCQVISDFFEIQVLKFLILSKSGVLAGRNGKGRCHAHDSQNRTEPWQKMLGMHGCSQSSGAMTAAALNDPKLMANFLGCSIKGYTSIPLGSIVMQSSHIPHIDGCLWTDLLQDGQGCLAFNDVKVADGPVIHAQ